MLHSPFAEYVPLPDVEERTEGRLVVRKLGLPGDFDPSDFLLNTAGVSRTATVAGLGQVSITGGPGERDQVSTGFRGVNGDGSLIRGGISRVVRAPLHTETEEGFITTPGSDAGLNRYYRPGVLGLNMTAIKSRAEERNSRKNGELDGKTLAHFMNLGVQDALWSEGVASHRPHKKDSDNIFIYGGAIASGYFFPIPDNLNYLVGLTFGLMFMHAFSKHADKLDRTTADSELPPRILSILPGVPSERIIVTGIMAYSTRMIRAAKPGTKKIIL